MYKIQQYTSVLIKHEHVALKLGIFQKHTARNMSMFMFMYLFVNNTWCKHGDQYGRVFWPYILLSIFLCLNTVYHMGVFRLVCLSVQKYIYKHGDSRVYV